MVTNKQIYVFGVNSNYIQREASMTSKKIVGTLISVFVLTVVLYWPRLAEAQSKPKSTVVMLAGYKLTPTVPTSASGTLTLSIKNDTLTVSGSFSDLTSPYYSSGIFYTQKKMAVNQLFTFDTELNEDHTGGKLKASANRFHLSQAHKELLKNGELVIRIMSTAHRRGEIGVGIPAKF